MLTFKDLPEEMQKELLNENRTANVSFDDWIYLGYYEEKLAELGFMEAQVHYSGFYTQGDGASFTCEWIDVLKWLEATNNQNTFQYIYLELKYGNNGEDLEINGTIGHSGRHYHEYSMLLMLDYDYYINENSLTDLWNEDYRNLESLMGEFMRKKAREIYSEILKEYESQQEDAAVIDFIENNIDLDEYMESKKEEE